jgi:orotate phosphoribosyltransferase-like protein
MKPDRVELIRKAQELRRLGLTYAVVGSRMGISVSTVCKLICEGQEMDHEAKHRRLTII